MTRYSSLPKRCLFFAVSFILYSLSFILYPSSFILCYELPSSTGIPHLFFTADEAEYDKANDTIHLKGRVKLSEKERGGGVAPRTMRAGELHIRVSSRIVVSPGEVLVEEGSNAIYGKSGWFNTSSHEGALSGVAAAYKPWRVEGESLEIKNRRHVYTKAVLTSCDMFPPHYRIKISRLTIIPERRLFATNAVFYLGKVPVLYSPFFYKSLRPDPPFVTKLRPGYDERNGLYLKTSTFHRFNDKTTGKLFLDYFSRRGLGTGGEVDYNDPENFRGNVSGYRIREYGTPSDRWGVGGGHWQKISPAYYSQSQFKLLSDVYFNNDFFRRNPFAVSPDMNASAAFVRQTSLTTTRLSFSRRDAQTSGTDRFHKVHESLPRLDFRTSPVAIKRLPVLHRFTGFFDNARPGGAGPFQKSAGGRWAVTQTIPVVRKVSIVPSGFYSENVSFSSRTAGGRKNLWIGLFGAGTNLRYDTLLGSIDIGYSYARRLKVNSFSLDSQSPDRGVESNRISFENFLRPSRRVYARVASGYDLINYRGYYPGVRERFDPVTGEIGYTPNPNFSVFARDEYDLKDGNISFFMQAEFGSSGTNHMGLGISHYSSSPSDYIVNQTVSLYPCRRGRRCSWHVDAVLRYVASSPSGMRFSNVRLFGKSLVLYKDFHDFRTSWNFRVRPGVREFSFTMDLKFNNVTKVARQTPDSDKFWHPWRKEGEERD